MYGRTSGNRSRSTFESTLAKGPSVNEMEDDVIDTVTDVKEFVAASETPSPQAVMAGLVPAIHVFGSFSP